MIRPEKTVDSRPTPDQFDEWEWGDGDMAPLLQHIRRDTAMVIADQITESCDSWFSENDGLFNVALLGVMEGGWIMSFDILKALAVGEIEFDDLETLKDFTQKIDAVSANLHEAIKIAEEGAAPEGAAPVT